MILGRNGFIWLQRKYSTEDARSRMKDCTDVHAFSGSIPKEWRLMAGDPVAGSSRNGDPGGEAGPADEEVQ